MSSVSVSKATSCSEKACRRTPHEIKIPLSVLPAPILNKSYCLTANDSGSLSLTASNIKSKGDLLEESFSSMFADSINRITFEKFLQSSSV